MDAGSDGRIMENYSDYDMFFIWNNLLLTWDL